MNLPEPDGSVTEPVVRVVERLDVSDLQREVVPSGWTLLLDGLTGQGHLPRAGRE